MCFWRTRVLSANHQIEDGASHMGVLRQGCTIFSRGSNCSEPPISSKYQVIMKYMRAHHKLHSNDRGISRMGLRKRVCADPYSCEASNFRNPWLRPKMQVLTQHGPGMTIWQIKIFVSKTILEDWMYIFTYW